MYALWWLDPFRIRRLPALAGTLACLAALVGYSLTWPDEAWRGYYDDGYLSKFARSGVTAVSDFINYGFMESDAATDERLNVPLVDSCHPAGRRPNIIMIHDELSFDIRSAEGIKVPPGYGSHFKSFDGKERTFLAESNGGPSWFTEYNVLAGLSSRSFGRFAYFVTRIAVGPRRARTAAGAAPLRLRHALALSRLWRLHERAQLPDHDRHRAFLRRARSRRQGRRARQLLLRQGAEADGGSSRRDKPLFTFVYLAANHFPWETQIPPRPDAVLARAGQRAVGRRISAPAGDERRATTRPSSRGLKKNFPGEPFLIVRYGDHQPEFSPQLLDPGLDEAGIGKKLDAYDPRYYATYYAIDAVNFEPVKSPAVMDTIDGAYLPLVIQEAAGIPLDPSFAEQKRSCCAARASSMPARTAPRRAASTGC